MYDGTAGWRTGRWAGRSFHAQGRKGQEPARHRAAPLDLSAAPAGGADRCRPGSDRHRRLDLDGALSAGRGDRRSHGEGRPARPGAHLRAHVGRLCAELVLHLGASLCDGRRVAADGARSPQRPVREFADPLPAFLRPTRSRRSDEPVDERHGEHQHGAGARRHPARFGRLDPDRRCRRDAPAQLAAGARHPGDDPGDDAVADPLGGQSHAGRLPAATVILGQTERPHRGDDLRPARGQGVRPRRDGDSGIRHRKPKPAARRHACADLLRVHRPDDELRQQHRPGDRGRRRRLDDASRGWRRWAPSPASSATRANSAAR